MYIFTTEPSEDIHKVPPDKLLFEFSQPPSDFSIHPQMTGTSSDTESAEIICDQPRLYRPHSHDQSERPETDIGM